MTSLYEVSPSERANQALTPEKVGAIVCEVRDQGYAVVSGLVSQESRELLLKAICSDARAIRARGEITPHEQHTGIGHLQLGLRRGHPFVREDLLFNSFVEQIVQAVLGEGAWLGFYNGNVNMPESEFQPLHFDRPFTWKSETEALECGESWPPRTTTLSCSVALDDINLENGATEIYPGSHRETAVTQWVPGERPDAHPELLEKWGPPCHMEMPAGSICFRDPRMWHRGVPNRTKQIRPMIALTYHAKMANHWRGIWVKEMSANFAAEDARDTTLKIMDDGSLGDGRLVFESSAQKAFEASTSRFGVNRNARFVEQIDHTLDAHLVGGARVIRDPSSL
jgi:hypothetical protein